MDSILTSVKKLLGIVEEDTSFDVDIIMHINSVFSILTQLGAGPETGFSISDSTSTWSDFLGDATTLEFVKSYVQQKVRLLFDPPLSSSVKEAIEQLTKELEWRIQVSAEPKADTDEESEVNEDG